VLHLSHGFSPFVRQICPALSAQPNKRIFNVPIGNFFSTISIDYDWLLLSFGKKIACKVPPRSIVVIACHSFLFSHSLERTRDVVPRSSADLFLRFGLEIREPTRQQFVG
jgi:hypothetical protein